MTQVVVVQILVPKLAKTRGRVFLKEGENDGDIPDFQVFRIFYLILVWNK